MLLLISSDIVQDIVGVFLLEMISFYLDYKETIFSEDRLQHLGQGLLAHLQQLCGRGYPVSMGVIPQGCASIQHSTVYFSQSRYLIRSVEGS